MTRHLEKGDTKDYKDPKFAKLPTIAPIQSNKNMLCEDSRASCPAWTFRELEQNRWEKPFLNPIDRAFKPFETEQMIRRKEVESYQHPKDVQWENMGPAIDSIHSFSFQSLIQNNEWK